MIEREIEIENLTEEIATDGEAEAEIEIMVEIEIAIEAGIEERGMIATSKVR
jgi:hypothetical protein